MKIYTRKGDEGETALIGGRCSKDDVRVEAYGTVDELNAYVALAASQMNGDRFSDMKQVLLQIQHELFDCGSDLAKVKPAQDQLKVTASMVVQLEAWIDHYEQELPELRRFILPGGSTISAALHVCRTVCRRAERRIVSLAKEHEMNVEVRTYINRLSDLFFTLARAANVREQVPDVEYVRSAIVFGNGDQA